MDAKDTSFKVVILGSGRVGKTSLLLKYVRDKFDTGQISTINAQFLEKKETIDGETATLHIWDTAGQEKFKAIAPIYYRRAAAALLVFDLTDVSTFPEALQWVPELRSEGALIALVGNKVDLNKSRRISEAEVRRQAQELGVSYYYTSAKTGAGVGDVFRGVLADLLRNSRREGRGVQRKPSKKVLKLTSGHEPKSSDGCC